MALLHPGELRAAAPRCDGSSSVFNYRGGWDVWLSCDEPLDERQRAERWRWRWRLGLKKVTLTSVMHEGGFWLVQTGMEVDERIFLKPLFFHKVCHHLHFCTFGLLWVQVLVFPNISIASLCPPCWLWDQLCGLVVETLYICRCRNNIVFTLTDCLSWI